MAKKTDERCRLFAHRYLVDFNGVATVKDIGHQGTDAALAVVASRYLKDPRVQTELQKALKDRIRRTGVTADQVVRELARLGFSDIRDVCEWDEGGQLKLKSSRSVSKKIARAIKKITQRVVTTEHSETVTTTVELHDKVKPLELLGKHTDALSPGPGEGDADQGAERVIVHLPDNGREREDR